MPELSDLGKISSNDWKNCDGKVKGLENTRSIFKNPEQLDSSSVDKTENETDNLLNNPRRDAKI